MNITVVVAGLALVGAAHAQTPAKPAGLGKTEAVSNADVNICAYIELLRADVRNSKSQIMGDIMQLDAARAAAFWPIYKEFDVEFAALGDKVLAVIKQYAKNYANMTDPVADGIAKQVLSIEEQRNELKKKYYERLKTALGAIAATRFLQVENQLERLVDLQIAAELPVISQR